MKTCTKCGEHKPLFNFFKDKSSKDNLCRICKPCSTENLVRWRKLNPEKVSKQNKRWKQNNVEKVSEYNKNWDSLNRHKRLAINAKRRATQLQATPPWLSPEHHAEIALCYEEAAALRLYTGQQYHVDHIVPLQGKTVCGLHVPWNLQVLLARDNIRKSNNFEG